MAKSEYLQREEAAKKQLGTKGVKKRVKQLPTAARASLREMTGIDVSRKGVSVDPIGLAMAVSPFKLLKASKALRAAGQIDRALGVEARVAAKALGGSRKAKGLYPGKAFLGETGQAAANRARQSSEFVFPRRSGAQSGEFLGMNSREITANLARKTGRAVGLSIEDIRAFSKATANSTTGFTNFSKRVPKVVKGVGTVNPEGYAALQKKPDFLGKGAFNVANKNPKRSRRGGR